MTVINFRKAVYERAMALKSPYTDNRTDYRKLLFFMDTNDWFQIEHTGSWDEITVSELPADFPRLDLWLSAYGLPPEQSCTLLGDFFRNTFPLVYERLTQFFLSDSAHSDDRDRLICMDYLLTALDTDASSWTDSDICRILSEANRCLPKKTFAVLSGFCGFMSQEGRTYIPVQEIHSRPTNAFSLRDYAKMCWLTLDEQPIQNGGYMEKAAADARSAEIWLFTALHFVSAVRVPDLCALPVPKLPETGEAMRTMILNGTFDNKSATELATSWLYRIEMENPTPNKTRRYSGVPPLMLNISTGYLPVFGKILALAASYCENGRALISNRYVMRTQMKAFFGPDFVNACGNEFFMSTKKFNNNIGK